MTDGAETRPEKVAARPSEASGGESRQYFADTINPRMSSTIHTHTHRRLNTVTWTRHNTERFPGGKSATSSQGRFRALDRCILGFSDLKLSRNGAETDTKRTFCLDRHGLNVAVPPVTVGAALSSVVWRRAEKHGSEEHAQLCLVRSHSSETYDRRTGRRAKEKCSLYWMFCATSVPT